MVMANAAGSGGGDSVTHTGPIDPIYLGIICDPPCLVMTYAVTGPSRDPGWRKSRRQRKMPLRNFTDRSDIQKMYAVLKQRHDPYLSPIPCVMVLKMLRVVQEVMKGLMIDEAVGKVDSEFGIDPEQDLNKLSLEELARKKEIMDEGFFKKVIKPGDQDFVYDKVEDFGDVAKEPCDWDEDGDEEVENDMDHVNLEDKISIKDPDEDNHIVVEDDGIGFPEKEDLPLDEQLLLSICDGEINNDNDELDSLCDFSNLQINLPFGNEDDLNVASNQADEQDDNEHDHDVETGSDSPRHHLYLFTGESNDNTQNPVKRYGDDDQVTIDIGVSYKAIDLDTLSLRKNDDEKQTEFSRTYLLVKQEMQKNVEHIESAAMINEIVRETCEEAMNKSENSKTIKNVKDDVEETTPTLENEGQCQGRDNAILTPRAILPAELSDLEQSVFDLDPKVVAETGSNTLGESTKEKVAVITVSQESASSKGGKSDSKYKLDPLQLPVMGSDQDMAKGMESLLDDDFWCFQDL